VADKKTLLKALPKISGVMFHFNCENDDFRNFSANLEHIGKKYGDVLKKLEWVSIGGGIYFTKDGFLWTASAKRLKNSRRNSACRFISSPASRR